MMGWSILQDVHLPNVLTTVIVKIGVMDVLAIPIVVEKVVAP
jgi:hypothetical protein